MSSSQKKVIVRRFLGELLHGYLPPSRFVQGGEVTLLDLQGRIVGVPLAEIKTISFVRDFNVNDLTNPERLQRRTFLPRPRGEGLWLRLAFRQGGDLLEGLAPSDLSLLSDLAVDAGLQFAPPDLRSNTQRIYVPFAAIAELTLLAVITSPSKRKALLNRQLEPGQETPAQETLFGEEI